MLPPDDAGMDADPTECSATRAFEHVRSIAGEPRPLGSAADARAGEYIATQLAALGLEPERQELTVPDYYAPSGGTVTAVNVMARIPGANPTGAIALSAHVDTEPGSPGARRTRVPLIPFVAGTARSRPRSPFARTTASFVASIVEP